jgi:hypothetical protein
MNLGTVNCAEAPKSDEITDAAVAEMTIELHHGVHLLQLQ